MILSIGIDTVTISNVERFLGHPDYAEQIFTKKEQKQAEEYGDVVDAYASAFAAKQAVKKVLDHFMDVDGLDMRRIEILKKKGIPYVKPDAEIQAVLDEKGVKSVMVTITSEGDSATAFVVAQQ